MVIDYKEQGRKNRIKGLSFELKIRRDLEKQKWIVSKWQNNLDYPDNNINLPPEKRKDYKCVPAKMGVYRTNQNGFPDFICYKKNKGAKGITRGFGDIGFKIIFVEVKTKGYLVKEEKEKALWYLENGYCSEFYVASELNKEIKYKRILK